ncbi:TonB-dependent receptor plug domain-containing protein [Aquimarina sp. 2-A2]|uniref:TonB-dependent receptor n=1 Tax=Aquimarina sp. 2-A2 TaxID=3382644 RepID=UPI00387F1B1E
MIKKYNFFVIIVIFFNIFKSYSQEKLPLQEVLIDVEKRFQCNFSYANEDVTTVLILPPDTDLNFVDTIKYLENNTNLVFNTLESKFITITSKEVSKILICGIIRDFETKEPLQNVTIRTSETFIISDFKGYYELDQVKANDSVHIRHLGYNQLLKGVDQFKKGGCETLFLSPRAEELETIIIKNYLTQGINKTTEGSLYIDYDQFGILPGLIENDALQTIQTLPGINSFDETVTNINIRGGTHDQNLITWNGIKMYQSGHFFSYISAFDPNLIHKTTLIKNGTPASLTDGVSGTIQMQSKDERSSEFGASLGFNFINVDGRFDIPLGKKASLQIAGRRSYNDILETHTYQNYFEKAFQNTEVVSNESNVIEASDNFRFFDIGTVLLYDVTPKDKIKASLIAMDNGFSFLESAFINNEEQSRESSSTQRNLGGSISYQRNWNEKLSTTIEFYGVTYRLRAENVDILNDQKLTQENKVLESSVKIISDLKLNEKLSVQGGYEFVETGVSNLEETDSPFSRLFGKDLIRKHAVFTQIDYTPWRGSHLKAGIRLNYINPFDEFIIAPRIHYNQRLSNRFILDVAGEFKNQAMTQTIDFQSDFLGVEKRRWILSNQNGVPILKSKQGSLGLTYKHKGWLCNIETYIKNVDGIVAQSQEFRNQYERSQAVGSYEIAGVDFIFNKKIHQFSGWLSYSYADNTYSFKTLQEDTFPSNLNIRHIIAIGANYTKKGLKISAGLNWRTGKPTTRPVNGNEVINNRINYEPPNSRVLSEYLRLDASVTYDFNLTNTVKIHTGFSIWNLTNQKSELSNYYEFTDINFPQEVVQNSLELTTNAVIKVSF